MPRGEYLFVDAVIEYKNLGDAIELSNRPEDGNFSITLGLPDGQETKLEGRFTSISGMKDGKWVYIVDHASAPLPPPPTMEEMQMMMKEMGKKK